MLTGQPSLRGAALGDQMCVSASLIIPFNTPPHTHIHTRCLTSLPMGYLQVFYETLKPGNTSI